MTSVKERPDDVLLHRINLLVAMIVGITLCGCIVNLNFTVLCRALMEEEDANMDSTCNGGP